MRKPANVARHPIHPMLVPIPIGLWIFSLACDSALAFRSGGDARRAKRAFKTRLPARRALTAAIPQRLTPDSGAALAVETRRLPAHIAFIIGT